MSAIQELQEIRLIVKKRYSGAQDFVRNPPQTIQTHRGTKTLSAAKAYELEIRNKAYMQVLGNLDAELKRRIKRLIKGPTVA